MTEAPFSAIPEEAFQAHLALIEHADAVVLCSIPFGFGNLKNMEAAEAALRMSKSVLMIEAKRVKNQEEILTVLGKKNL